jgi:hypothetical protein
MDFGFGAGGTATSSPSITAMHEFVEVKNIL